MTTSINTVEDIKRMLDELQEKELCEVIEHIAKKVWIPIHIPRESFDIPVEDYQSVINDTTLSSRIDGFTSYLLQNRFDNLESDTTSTTSSEDVAVAEVELDNDNDMTVEGLFDLMSSQSN